jgi:hypothetical protein
MLRPAIRKGEVPPVAHSPRGSRSASTNRASRAPKLPEAGSTAPASRPDISEPWEGQKRAISRSGS